MTAKQPTHENLYHALAAAQAEIKNPEKTKTAKAGSYEYKYADIADVLNEVLPVLTKHGLSVAQPTRVADGALIVVTRLHHTSGDCIESEYPVCMIANTDHQKMGAAMTYARRYALTSLIGVAAEDDADGQNAAKAGGATSRVSAQQARTDVDWSAVENSIRNAETLRKLDNISARVDDHERRGSWPRSYISSARDMIDARRDDLARDANGHADHDPNKYLSDLDAEMSGAGDQATLDEIWLHHAGTLESLFPPDQTAAGKLYDKHKERLAA